MVRLGQDLEFRGSEYGISLRSAFNAGLPVLNYTRNRADAADDRLFFWFGSARVRLDLPLGDFNLESRVDAQLRIPVFESVNRYAVELAAFFDGSHAWDTKQRDIGSNAPLLIGVGAHFRLHESIGATIEWAHTIKDLDFDLDRKIQDRDIHF